MHRADSHPGAAKGSAEAMASGGGPQHPLRFAGELFFDTKICGGAFEIRPRRFFQGMTPLFSSNQLLSAPPLIQEEMSAWLAAETLRWPLAN